VAQLLSTRWTIEFFTRTIWRQSWFIYLDLIVIYATLRRLLHIKHFSSCASLSRALATRDLNPFFMTFLFTISSDEIVNKFRQIVELIHNVFQGPGQLNHSKISTLIIRNHVRHSSRTDHRRSLQLYENLLHHQRNFKLTTCSVWVVRDRLVNGRFGVAGWSDFWRRCVTSRSPEWRENWLKINRR